MPTIAIKLDPAKMDNPDLDVRYEIPDRIVGATNGQVIDDGFDYVDGDSIVIYLKTDSQASLQDVMRILGDEEFSGNKILDSARIGFDAGGGYVGVYPPDAAAEEFGSSNPDGN